MLNMKRLYLKFSKYVGPFSDLKIGLFTIHKYNIIWYRENWHDKIFKGWGCPASKRTNFKFQRRVHIIIFVLYFDGNLLNNPFNYNL